MEISALEEKHTAAQEVAKTEAAEDEKRRNASVSLLLDRDELNNTKKKKEVRLRVASDHRKDAREVMHCTQYQSINQ